MRLAIRPWPASHLGWHAYYAKRFNKTQHPDAEHLALYYLLLALRDGDAR